MGVVISDSRRQCNKTTKTTKTKMKDRSSSSKQLQAASYSFTVPFIMGLLMMLLVQRAAAAATAAGSRSTEAAHIAGGGAVMQLTHRMAALEGSRARQEGKGITIEHYNRMLSHDRIRFNRIMSSMRGRQDLEVVDFTLSGNFNTDSLYYTEVQLGTPAQTFYVQMDTGSDLLWVDCSPCIGCPRSSALQVPLSTYSESASSTSQGIGCNNSFCITASNQLDNGSLTCTSECPFESLYGDGSTVSGSLVSDVLTFTEISSSSRGNGSTRVSFGCGFSRSGSLRSTEDAVDGLIGFGQSSISVLSQLAANGTTPNIFAHCLQGDSNASSTLVIGEITEPGIVYTSMVPNATHYAAILLNIAVGASNLSSSPVLTNGTGAELQVIFDSGTTLAYLVDPFYTDFMTALNASINMPVQSVSSGGSSTISCYVSSSSQTPTFPNLTLYFEGGVMELGSDAYLQELTDGSGNYYYCPMWQLSSGQAATDSLLGDIVLQNQIIVYNNQDQKLGWKNFNCTQTISASITPNGPPVAQPPNTPASPATTPPTTTNPYGNGAEMLRAYQSLSLALILCILGYIATM